MTREKPDNSKPRGTVRKREPFEYVLVPKYSFEKLTTTMEKSRLVDSDADADREKSANPHLRIPAHAMEASSDPARSRKIDLPMHRLERALNKAERSTSRGPRSERSLSPRNQHRIGSRNAKGRIPRTRDASRNSSIGNVVNGQARRRTTGKGRAVSFDNGNDQLGSFYGDAGSDDTKPAARG